MCTDLIFRRITFTTISCLLSFMVQKTTADFMELISHTNEGAKKFDTSVNSPIYTITPFTARKN